MPATKAAVEQAPAAGVARSCASGPCNIGHR